MCLCGPLASASASLRQWVSSLDCGPPGRRPGSIQSRRSAGSKQIMKLENQSAIVTGAGQGLGKSIAMALAREGASVLLSGRHRETLEGVAQEIAQLGGRSVVSVTDVSDEAAVKQMVGLALA